MMSRQLVPVRRCVGVMLFAALMAGCDVTNPGQILDDDLNNAAAIPILVTGMAGDFEVGLRDIGWNNAVLIGDLSGTSAYLSRQRHWAGNPQPEDADEYNSVYRARWVAESGIERMKTVLGASFASSPYAAEAYMWAGFANRLLGETMCAAVIDGGPLLPRMAYFARAESAFTNAIQIATAAGATAATTQLAAYGGRASVRLVQGNWAGALSDAGKVPTTFSYISRFSTSSLREQNQIFAENRQRVNLSVKYTWFEKYATASHDARTVVGTDPKLTISADGVSPHLIQGKYNELGADVVLTRGAEMRLIEAENEIVNGTWQTGVAMINALRAAAGVAPVNPTTKAEAFDRLKEERAIVMWLESRRGGDLFRWGGSPAADPILKAMAAAAPGNLPLATRAICSPFSQTLLATNPALGGNQ
ncbi:MAG: RagB/SusD family nutrient uptake outer membrane protein [Gemmatimonadaceae bacterium]